MTSFTPNPLSPRQARIERICSVFSEPPRLRAVAVQWVQGWLDQKFAALQLTADMLFVGLSVENRPAYTCLSDVLLERLASGQVVLYTEGYHAVVKQVGDSYLPAGIALQDVEHMVNQQGPFMLLAWRNAWQAWWYSEVPGAKTRFEYLADALLDLMYESPKPNGMTDPVFTALFPRDLLRASHLVRAVGLPDAQVNLQTLHVRSQDVSDTEPAQMLPGLVLKHVVLSTGAQTLLLFSPATGLHTLTRMDDALGLLTAAFGDQKLEWFALEPLEDPFSLLAAECAEEQGREIEAITPRQGTSSAQLLTLMDHIIDPRRWFVAPLTSVQQRLEHALPLWLAHASDEDLTAFTRHLVALVNVQLEAAGHDFYEGIESIEQFATNALQACLDAEPSAVGVRADDIALKFTRVTGAGMPGGFAVGEVEHLTLSLTQLALENLSGFAQASADITVKGRPAPAALTYTLLKRCVTQADVGQRYPDLLKRMFMTDTVEATRREHLFVTQLRAQLPLLALGQKIKGEQGLTASGYRWLAAAVQTTTLFRRVDGQTAALWPLAFKARPGDSPDTVANMYIIGPESEAGGPRLLYRPLLQPVLHEYESLEALFAAIKMEGPLQDSVLEWIDPARRHVYANGGFAEPHVEQWGGGDEFSLPTPPMPVQLSQQTVTGDPLHQVFVGTVQAFVTLADKASISNAQARWATLKTGGWLLFGALMPLVTGPLGLAGWLLQLMASVQQDIAELADPDSQDKSRATVDLLINLVLVLAHQVEPLRVSEQPLFKSVVSPAPRNVVPGTRLLNNTRPGGWFSGSDELSPALQARVEGMSLKPEAAKGMLEAHGAFKGLFREDEQWQAEVRGHRYRVHVQQGSVRVVSADGVILGPWLKRLADDRWDIDLRLRLAGGNADEAIAERQRADAGSAQGLESELARLRQQIKSAEAAIKVAHGVMGSRAADDAQYAAVQNRFMQELERKLNYMLLEVDALKRLRSMGPRRGYEQELCTSLEGMILTEQSLSVEALARTISLHTVLGPALERQTPVGDDGGVTEEQRQNQQLIAENTAQLAEINDKAIRWRSMEDQHLQALRQVPRFGRDRAEALASNIDTPRSVLDLRVLQVSTLWELALDRSRAKNIEDFSQELNKVVERAHRAAFSHASLEHLTQASDAERIELLESVDRVYAQTEDSLEFWREMEADCFNAEFLSKLQQQLTLLRADAKQQLTDLIPADATQGSSIEPAPSLAPAPGQVRKKIIRTRNRDMLVATIRPVSADAPGEVAELIDDSGQVTASLTAAQDGVWDEVQAPAIPRVPGPGLARLLEQSQKLLEEVEPTINKVFRLASTANEPQSLQDILNHKASTLRKCADEISRHLLQDKVARLAATQRARAQTRVDELTAAASRLDERGLQARVNAIKARPPTQTGIDFLASRNEVRIYRMEGRVPLKGKRNDFLQVYGVFDVHDRQALCYAHFHYESARAFNDGFTAAHLKTPEQHRMGKQAQAHAEAQAFARIQAGQSGRAQPALDIYRSAINLYMARRLFFDAPLWMGH